jgi:endonuclease/exonuclease/phosphatase family metal-dependent hydrolase
VRVATWNIRHAAPAGRRVDHLGFAAAIATLDVEVLGLQEVDRRVVRSGFRDQSALAGRLTGMQDWFGRTRRLGGIGEYGNTLLTRTSPAWVTRQRLPAVGEPRGVIVARVPTSIGPVTVATTHLQNRRVGRPDEAPDQLAVLLARLDRFPGPQLLMGDLNLHPDRVEPIARAAGFTPVDSDPTFCADLPSERIDWLLLRGLVARRSWVPDLRASDHRPLVAELAPS